MYCDYEKRLFEVLDRFLKFLGKYIDKKFRREKIKECDIHQVLELKSLRKDRGQIEEKKNSVPHMSSGDRFLFTV